MTLLSIPYELMKPVFTVVLFALLVLSAYKYFQKPPMVEKLPEPTGLMVKDASKDAESSMKPPADAVKYMADPSLSKIEWSSEKKLIDWKHNGTVAVKSGELYKVMDPVKGDSVMGKVVVDMNTIVGLDTNSNEKLVGHLKSPDFFDVATYPTATLEFTAVADATNILSKGTAYKATGTLTVRGKTNPVEFSVVAQETPEGIVTGTTDLVIDRSKFDIKFGSAAFFSLEKLGNNLIVDEIPLKITLIVLKDMATKKM